MSHRHLPNRYKALSKSFYQWTDKVVAANVLSNAVHHFQFSVKHRYFVKLRENRDLCVKQREDMGQAVLAWTQRKERMAVERWIEFCHKRQQARDRMMLAIQAAEDSTMAKAFRSWRDSARNKRIAREDLQVAVVYMERNCVARAMRRWIAFYDERCLAHEQVGFHPRQHLFRS